MPSEEKRYETTEIKAIRGTESKTITRKEQEGWELVTQQEGRLRTAITFRRPKPKTPWKVWAALGGAGVVLAGIMTTGVLLEDDRDSFTTEVNASSGDELEPSSSADPMICETSPGGEPCKFGQTAIYSDTVRAGEVKLEITVGAPVEFTVSDDAISRYGPRLQPVSVYFPVTIKNESSVRPSMFQGQVTNAQQESWIDLENVRDGDVGLGAVSGVLGLPAGQTLSVKDGWSMATLVGVEYLITIDGLAGYDVTFTR